ncbi:MAG: hypothetical protein K2G73_00875 [Eubacterium sp.]|nr:hypothetical protein [Eubacterium sp.]MDE5973203.1 hypothetical protein [Eubacterium sp.]
MDNAGIENGVIISKEEFERYNKLKTFRRNSTEQFDMIKILVFRLNVFINLLIENNDDREEIISNIQLAIEELSDKCSDYQKLIENQK